MQERDDIEGRGMAFVAGIVMLVVFSIAGGVIGWYFAEWLFA